MRQNQFCFILILSEFSNDIKLFTEVNNNQLPSVYWRLCFPSQIFTTIGHLRTQLKAKILPLLHFRFRWWYIWSKQKSVLRRRIATTSSAEKIPKGGLPHGFDLI